MFLLLVFMQEIETLLYKRMKAVAWLIELFRWTSHIIIRDVLLYLFINRQISLLLEFDHLPSNVSCSYMISPARFLVICEVSI